MTNYEEAKVKITNSQLKSAAKNKTGTTLKMSKKKFQSQELSYELLLSARQNLK